MLFSPATSQEQVRLYLDESGTLGFGDEVFTMAMVRVHDLPKLEACIARNKTTQAEIKASQMKTGQKLDLARKLLEQNSLQIYLLTIDPAAAYACERKLDKELLYDSMIAQAMAYYLGRNELPQGRSYRLSLDMRGGIRESFEDMVRESIGNVLMHRDAPLVTDLDIRYMDSKYSAGVQVADLFSNIYRTALSQKDSPCNGFLNKCRADGIVHVGFAFGLPELADQMAQIAAALRARVEYDAANNVASTFRTLPMGTEVTAGELAGIDEGATTEGGARAATAAKEQAGATDTADVDARRLAAQEAAPLQDARQTPANGEPATNGDAGDTGEAHADDTDARKPDPDGAAAVAETGTGADAGEMPRTLSRSARRRRSRAARKAADAAQEDADATDAGTQEQGRETGDQPAAAASKAASDQVEPSADSTESHTADQAEGAMPQAQASPKTRRRGRKPKAQAAAVQAPEAHAETAAPTEPAPAPEAADAAPVASEGEAHAAEPVVLTARERRQKAAKKTARGAAKHAQKAAEGQTDVAESEPAQVGAPQPASAPATAPDGVPQPAAAPDAAAQPEKPKRTRTRTRSKAKPATPVAEEAAAGTQTGTGAPSQPEEPSSTADIAGDPAPTKPRTRRTRKTAAASNIQEPAE